MISVNGPGQRRHCWITKRSIHEGIRYIPVISVILLLHCLVILSNKESKHEGIIGNPCDTSVNISLLINPLLRRHYENQTFRVRYPCDECNQRYNYMHDLRKHKERIHCSDHQFGIEWPDWSSEGERNRSKEGRCLGTLVKTETVEFNDFNEDSEKK